MSKGSHRRPLDRRYCTDREYGERFDAIDWGKKPRTDNPEPEDPKNDREHQVDQDPVVEVD